MNGKRQLALGLALAAALALAGLAAACGGGGESEEPEESSSTMETHMQTALDHTDEMIAAAKEADLEAAKAHFEEGHDPLHEVIEDLGASDPDLAADLDEAVDDAEKDFEEGADADHIVEIGNDILDLLEQVE